MDDARRRLFYSGEWGCSKIDGFCQQAHVSKNLSELERLRLMVAKLEIENERLKKGYWVEGVGANKVFVTGPGKSTKSSKH